MEVEVVMMALRCVCAVEEVEGVEEVEEVEEGGGTQAWSQLGKHASGHRNM